MNRRELLKGMGAASVLFGARRALGQTTGPKRKVVIVTMANGVHDAHFFPAVGALTDAVPHTLEPLKTAGLLQRLTVLRNLDHPAGRESRLGGHASYMTLLTGVKAIPGWAGGPSWDKVVARQLRDVYGSSLHERVHVQAGGAQSVPDIPIWEGAGAPVPVTQSPAQTFARLFGDPKNIEANRRRLLDRTRVVDAHFAELKAAAARVSGSDLRLVQSHLEAIDQVERSLDPANQPNLAACLGTAPDGTPSSWDLNLLPALSAANNDVVTTALRCGLTQVATVQLIDGAGSYATLRPGNTLGIACSQNLNVHAHLSHGGYDPNNRAVYDAKCGLDRFLVGTVADLVKKLKAARDPGDPDRSVFDHTIVLVLNAMNHSGGPHTLSPVPTFYLAGSAITELKVGQCIDAKGSINELFVSLAHALGAGSVQSFGDSKYCSGPLEAVMS